MFRPFNNHNNKCISYLPIFIIIISILSTYTDSLYTNSRIQCEYRDRNGESLILNCTLVTGSSSSLNSGSSNPNSNELLAVSPNLNSGESSGIPASNSMNIKVGMDRSWRTPWESLTINHNIIRTLIWSNSRLAELGDHAFKDLNFLQKIDLSSNKLQYIQLGAFRSFELDILDLDLSQNQFSFIPEKIFLNRQLRNLEIFRMNENQIQIITHSSFEHLRNLKLLELNYCQIKQIEDNSFDNLRSLESLSLIGNHLRQLNEMTFRPFNLRSFYVHENPLNCDCNLRWLLDYLKNVDYQQQIYESQITLTHPSLSWAGLSKSTTMRHKIQSVAQAAQDYLKCDQPNSLKSKQNFLDINPDSFMCDIRLEFADNRNESSDYELGDDALLVCNVYGDPEPDVYWSFGDRTIQKIALNTDEENKYIWNEMYSIRKTNKTSELRIRNLNSNDFGVYVCTAEIRGSTNRKSIRFNLRKSSQILGTKNALTSLTSIFDLIVNSIESFLLYISNNLLNNKNVSNTTLLILFSIFISLLIFLLFLCLFACWKFSCCFKSSRNNSKKQKFLDIDDLKEEKHLLDNHHQRNGSLSAASAKLLTQGKHLDDTDNHHHHQNHYIIPNSNNYTNLANDSSATLISNHNRMTNSIRMAYPNNNNNNLQQDIYANHSLLTTTSSTTASYMPHQHQQQQIAIDTSNQTPRFHLLHQQQQQHQQQDAYYDDLRNAANGNEIYSSPYRMGQNGSGYSPVIRRDDPTIPLYATLKPKLHSQRGQNYSAYTTMNRNNNNTPPLPVQHRKHPHNNNNNNYLLNLPPPPPPPPQIHPPLKPKRTFEYTNRDLYSDSGALLLNSNNSEASNSNSSHPSDFDTSSNLILNNNMNQAGVVGGLICVNNPKIDRLKNQYRSNNKNNNNGSTTSLEEDLDLNDLKDFEDVTFDNLSKPNENHLSNNNNNNNNSKLRNQGQQQNVFRKLKTKHSLMNKLQNDMMMISSNKQGSSSDQSLLLKSSSSSEKSSSDNTINNIDAKNSATASEQHTNNSPTNQNNEPENEEEKLMLQREQQQLQDKIYEETEI
jgi:hypothetical protein